MTNDVFSPMEIDAIGEIMNISLGSSATAVSNMLDHRVDITTPKVTVMDSAEFSLGNMEPAIGIEIRYVSGLEGSNIMLLKRSDVKVIVDILMGSETPDDEFEFNELTISAVCEVMNQMMGAASTAMSDFLGKLVNISTPKSFELDDFEEFKEEHFPSDAGSIIVVRFELGIEDALRSEFIYVMSLELARELISGFNLDDSESDIVPSEDAAAMAGSQPNKVEDEPQMQKTAEPALLTEPTPAAGTGDKLGQAEIERLIAGTLPQPEPPQPAASTGGTLSQAEIERLMAGSAPTIAPPAQQPQIQQPAPQEPTQQQQTPTPEPSITESITEAKPTGAGQGAQQPPAYPAADQLQPPMQGYPYPAAPGMYPPPYGQPVQGYFPYGGYYMPEPPRDPPEPKVISTQAVQMPKMEMIDRLGEEQAQNLDLIMSVPLEVSVEIGRTHKKVQDILTFSKGSLVVLDKLAGDQVDLFVNGQCIARGDVVVIDDNFGIRITEILKNPDLADFTHP